MTEPMNCPHCDTHIDKHEATRCLDAWVVEKIMDFDVRIGEDAIGEFLPLILDSRGSYYAGGDGVLEKPVVCYSTDISVAKQASDKAGCIVVFAPNSAVRDGSYANRKKSWLVEMIPHKGTTNDSVWTRGETEELARCRAAIKLTTKEGE